MLVQSYLFFDGRREEAIEFYKAKVLGAKVEMLMRFKESPEPPPPGMVPPGAENKVMHSSLPDRRDGGDGVRRELHREAGLQRLLAVGHGSANEGEAERVFAALGDGGQVQMPLAKTFFSPRFGMVADKFGVSWMVIVEAPGKKG